MDLTDAELQKLLKEGKSQAAIAKKYNVSRSAISQRVSKFKGASVEVIASSKKNLIKKTVNQNLNAIGQLQKINQVTNKLLDELTGEEQTIDRMVKAVERSLAFEGDQVKMQSYIRDIIIEINRDKNTALRACAEIRGQLQLQMDIFQTLYSMKAIEEFQRIVLDAIKSVDPELRDRIVSALNRERLLRDAFKPA